MADASPQASQYELEMAARLQAREAERKQQNREAAAFAKDFGDATGIRSVGRLAMYFVVLVAVGVVVLAAYTGLSGG